MSEAKPKSQADVIATWRFEDLAPEAQRALLGPEPEPLPGPEPEGDFPVGGSPEAVAEWFGFASVAELEASHEQYAAEMTKAAADEAEAEAEL